MFYLLTLLIVGLVIAPVLYLKPSPEQKRLESLRMHARSLKIQVTYTLPEDIGYGYQRLDGPAVVYRIPRADIDNVLPVDYQVSRGKSNRQEWFWLNKEKQPPAMLIEKIEPVLKQFPDDVKVVESKGNNLSVFWQERGTTDDVDTILALLQNIDSIETAFFASRPELMAPKEQS